jgi:transcriptional regulator GlxA family with amidase domain
MKPKKLKISLRQLATRRIGIVAFPGSQILDIAGPLAVFAEANQFCREYFNAKQAAYQVELISTESDRLVDCYCGVNITAQSDFRSVRGKFDTLLIAGGYGGLQVEKIAGFLPWLRKTSKAARRRLEESSQSIELIAEECGFGSAESMRSAFQRLLRVSPQEYRKRFHIAERGENKDESATQPPRLRQNSDGRDRQRRRQRHSGKSGKGKHRREQTVS